MTNPRATWIWGLGGVIFFGLLAATGFMWFASLISGVASPDVPPPDRPAFVRTSGPPRLAAIPWTRSIAQPTPLVIPEAETPWMRSSADARPVTIALAVCPWCRNSAAPAPVTIRTAAVPWTTTRP